MHTNSRMTPPRWLPLHIITHRVVKVSTLQERDNGQLQQPASRLGHSPYLMMNIASHIPEPPHKPSWQTPCIYLVFSCYLSRTKRGSQHTLSMSPTFREFPKCQNGIPSFHQICGLCQRHWIWAHPTIITLY